MEGLWGKVPASPATLTSATLFPLHFGFPSENSLTKGFYGLKKRPNIMVVVVGESLKF